MAYLDDMASDAEVAPKNQTRAGGGGSRFDEPKTTVMILTEKPRKIAGRIKFGLSPNYKLGEKTSDMGKYDLVGIEVDDDVFELTGQLLTSVGGISARFADPSQVSAEQKESAKIFLNGEKVYPIGDPVTIIVPFGTNVQKVTSLKPGGIVILEDVTVCAKSFPGSKRSGKNLEGALVHVPNSVLADPKKEACLVAVSPLVRPVTAFFRIGPNAKTVDSRSSYVKPVTMLSMPWYGSNQREGTKANDAPMAMGGIKGSMGVVVHVDMADTVASSAAAFAWAQQWQDHLKATGSTASAGVVFQLFRKPIGPNGEVLTGEDAQAHFDKMRAGGVEPQQSVTVIASNSRNPVTEKWEPQTMTQAIESLLVKQANNVVLDKSRRDEGIKTQGRMRTHDLRKVMDEAPWTIVCVALEAWNVAPSIKLNVEQGKRNPEESFQTWKRAVYMDKPTGKGNIVEYNALMGHMEISKGAMGTPRVAEGQTQESYAYMSEPGVKMGYLEVGVVDGGHVTMDIRPISKAEVSVPLRMMLAQNSDGVTITPPEHVADITKQLVALSINAAAVGFGLPRNKTQAPVNKPAAPAPETSDDPNAGMDMEIPF